jgi:hypothetical protein
MFIVIVASVLISAMLFEARLGVGHLRLLRSGSHYG